MSGVNIQTHHLYIRIKEANDSVKRNEHHQITQEHGFPTKLIKSICATLHGSKSNVQIGTESESETEVSILFVTLDGMITGRNRIRPSDFSAEIVINGEVLKVVPSITTLHARVVILCNVLLNCVPTYDFMTFHTVTKTATKAMCSIHWFKNLQNPMT